MSAGDQQELRDMRTAFHITRLVGEELLAEGTISVEHFSALMLKFESKLRELGDDL